MSEPAGDGIERLLKATGRRPAPAPERTARAREVLRARWRAELRHRARRRGLWIGVAAAAALVLAVLVARPWRQTAAPAQGLVARVERAELPGALRAGDGIEAGAELSTEAGGRLALRLGSGHAVRLDRGTRARLLSPGVLALEEGAIYVDSAGADGPLELRTSLGTLRDLGTQFLVGLRGGALRVHVREGSVAVTSGGVQLDVPAGHLLELSGAGRSLRAQVAGGPAWAWLASIAPMLRIEGRSASDFLEWVARERGLRLVFESEALARTAATTTLKGSIEGMTLEEALESVLPTCGMGCRIEGPVLRVTPVQGTDTGGE